MQTRHLPGWLKILINAGKSWNTDNAFKHSAAVSFYTLFSLAPITIIALAIAGYFFGKDAATQQLSDQMSQLVGKSSAEMIQKTAEASQPQNHSWIATAVGIAALLVGATTVFGQLQGSLNDIWGVETKPSKSGWLLLVMQRLVSFAMVVSVGFLLLVSLIISTALAAVAKYADGMMSLPPAVLQGVELGVSLGVITILFALIFKIMPDVILRWGEVWRGAFLTAVLFTVGRFLIALYLGHSNVASVYGAAGSLVALLVWIYYSSAILFFGAEFIRAYRLEHGRPTSPKETAVLVRKEIVSPQSKTKTVRKSRNERVATSE